MSKKPRHAHTPVSAADLRGRVEKALHESRTQQALELAKQLHKQGPTPEHRELLKRCYLERARQLRGGGYTRDAITVLNAAQVVDSSDPVWLGQIAEELAACGEARQALSIVSRFPEAPAQPRILARAADAALQQPAKGRATLAAEQHAEFDRIVTAFAQVEAGQDEAARETLQPIGLRSPFLEWKVLLRGLLAYYQNDDARALENWQRLSSERLPARLAAPFRFLIDPGYRAAQGPEAQALLQKQADMVQSEVLVTPLREIQKVLAKDGSLARAFRLAEPILPVMRQQAPKLVPRLATCFYWAIVNSGQPEDLLRYQRLFGAPADDPHFYRVNAMVMEQRGDPVGAHEAWAAYESWVAANPGSWPGDQARQVRALVWYHMGNNAALFAEESAGADAPWERPRSRRGGPEPLKPSADECLRRSIDLAPEQREAHESLFAYHLHHDQPAKAEKAGTRLLERFPDHVPTLVALGELRMKRGNYAGAIEAFQRAARVNPLERRLRDRISTAHTFKARAHAEAGEFDQARADYQSALAVCKNNDSVYCKWAACEFKANNLERAEELLRQALGEAGSRLAVAYSMLIEVIRLKLPRPLKRRFDQEFKEALAEEPTAAGAAAVADTAASHRLANVTYPGQKSHETQVTRYLGRAKKLTFTEEQLAHVCAALDVLKSSRLLGELAHLGQKRFPDSPTFYLVEADMHLARGPGRCRPWEVEGLLKKARECVEGLPPDEKRKQLLQAIQERLDKLASWNPFAALFARGLEGLFGGWEEAEPDDDADEFF